MSKERRGQVIIGFIVGAIVGAVLWAITGFWAWFVAGLVVGVSYGAISTPPDPNAKRRGNSGRKG